MILNRFVTGSSSYLFTSSLICLTVFLVVQRVVRHPGRRSVAAASGKTEKKGIIGAEIKATYHDVAYCVTRTCPCRSGGHLGYVDCGQRSGRGGDNGSLLRSNLACWRVNKLATVIQGRRTLIIINRDTRVTDRPVTT